MTYFNFLLIFVIAPSLIMGAFAWYDHRHNQTLPAVLTAYPARFMLLAHVIIAVVYTTPWDNYLVATNVWWYDPALVTGYTIGWVPIEEYTFFVVQPIFTGLWLLTLARRWPQLLNHAPLPTPRSARSWYVTALITLIWLISCLLLFAGSDATTYLALQLSWALFPILIQLTFGADILWHHRRLIAAALIPTTLYLAAADTIAISAGTWTIDPAQSLPWLIGGILPFEEFLFFLLTNILIVFGLTLTLATVSQPRWLNFVHAMRQKFGRSTPSRSSL
ncbi:MAG TPA: lycopene cyclase domain-containing protein [Anaerolineae bacterium]|nr:lycopene cyclase domain-containing protein [Anaerolineae bacterium]